MSVVGQLITSERWTVQDVGLHWLSFRRNPFCAFWMIQQRDILWEVSMEHVRQISPKGMHSRSHHEEQNAVGTGDCVQVSFRG